MLKPYRENHWVQLCLIATFFFYYQNEVTRFFSKCRNGKGLRQNIKCFSFTTVLPIGFGDIARATLLVRRAVMLVGLTEAFYTVFVTSIIIGKYFSLK